LAERVFPVGSSGRIGGATVMSDRADDFPERLGPMRETNSPSPKERDVDEEGHIVGTLTRSL
jgi:hypothetical protein